MRRLTPAILALIALLLAACDSAVTDPLPVVMPAQPATLAELTGPWRPTPLALDPQMRDRIEQACRADIEMPPGTRAALVDVRGGRVASVRMVGQGGGACHALEITAAGQVIGAGSGWQGADAGHAAGLGPAALHGLEKATILGGGLDVEGWSVSGQAGPAIALVVIQPMAHPPITATLQTGWFGAWWPARAGEQPRTGMQYPPFVVRAFDAAGALVAELRP